jgi:serine/threonine-protein kinase
MSELTGKTLGRYRVLERIGRGGMAEVYKAFQPALDRYVAVKVLHPFLLEEDGARERFSREARAVASLRHPNIVQVFDYDNEGDIYFMVMEFIDGPNLKQVLHQQAQQSKRLDLARIDEIITAIGGALAYAHSMGMIHRDVKPQNIMFTAKGQPLLTDFGIAKIVGTSGVSASGGLSGTPAYMSPEQGRGGPVDSRTDIYSLGVVLYEMITGRVPFDADTPFAVVIKHMNDPLPLPRSIDPAIPEALERVVLKAMAKAPDERYQTADEFARAAHEAIMNAAPADARPEHRPVMAPPLPGTPPAGPTNPPAPGHATTIPVAPAPPAAHITQPPYPAQPLAQQSYGPAPGAPQNYGPPAGTPQEYRPPAQGYGPPPGYGGPPPAPPGNRGGGNRLWWVLGGSAAGVLLLCMICVFVLNGINIQSDLNLSDETGTPVAVLATATTAPTQAGPAETTVPGTPAAPPTETAAPAETPAAETPGPTVGDVFVIPSVAPTEAPSPVPLDTAGATGPEAFTAQLNTFFDLFYKARTLEPGGMFDLATIGNLTAPPYRDYTLALLQQNEADAETGKLREANYANLSMKVLSFGHEADGSDNAFVEVTRTLNEVRADGVQPPQTGTYQFKLKRTVLADGNAAWQAYDFYNPATKIWISQAKGDNTLSPDQVQREMNDYFQRFYAARTLVPGGSFDLTTTGEMTNFAYRDYTLPLLQKQQDEASAGQLSTVNYSDIKVKLLDWNAQATDHGGIATVEVTRTSHVTRPGKAEEVQTGTYQFRLHRHTGDNGEPFWVAVDFLSPISNQWVSESAGMSGPVPPSGHG